MPDGDPNDVMNESLDLLDQTFSRLVQRARIEEPFSPDLAEGVAPTLDALDTLRQTFVSAARGAVEGAGDDTLAAMSSRLESIGGVDLLRAASAFANPPADGAPAERIFMSSGAQRVPWLEIVKEIVGVILDFIPGIGAVLGGVVKELLKIIDKIFGGMPHEDNGPGTTTTRPASSGTTATA